MLHQEPQCSELKTAKTTSDKPTKQDSAKKISKLKRFAKLNFYPDFNAGTREEDIPLLSIAGKR